MTDTSLPGTCCRDQVYFAGAVAVLENRKSLDFHYMHCGKVLIADGCKDTPLCNLVVKRRKEFTTPPHIGDLDAYLKRLDALAEANHVE